MTREDYLLKWESGKSVENIIDDFGDFRDRLVDRITEYVKEHNGEVELFGMFYHYAEEESVHTVKYEKLLYIDGNCVVDYQYSDGWELGWDTEGVADKLWKFSMNELFDILLDMERNEK